MVKRGKSKNKDETTTKGNFKKTKKNSLKKKWKPMSKAGRIMLKNLPFKATENDVQKLLLKYGDIREVKLLHRPDGSPVGCGFVQFTRKESAAEAIKNCSNVSFMGRNISVDWALPKAEYIITRVSDKSPSNTNHLSKMAFTNKTQSEDTDVFTEIKENNDSTLQGKHNKMKNKKRNRNKQPSVNDLSADTETNKNENLSISPLKSNGHLPDSFKFKEESQETETQNGIKEEYSSAEDEPLKLECTASVSSRPGGKKKKRLKSVNKKGRLIVRNLSFKVTEEVLKDHFSAYGSVTEVNLLKKPDGKLVGCAFIQFEKGQSAAKAILGSSGKELLGRTIIIDWAVPRTKYLQEVKNENQDGEEEHEIKQESDDDNNVVKSEDDVENTNASDSESNSEEEEEMSETDSDADQSAEDLDQHKPLIKKPRIISNDVAEGCTVFVKNVPFSATNEELKSCMERFGSVVYALICIDALTEHSKGTAFVKFHEKESAEECLKAGTELTLHDQILDVFRALNREELQQKTQDRKNNKIKDSRNLYLVKEGVVMAGTPAAAGVSVADMTRRLQLEKLKTQMLRNLNMFVSSTRLIVHNIPPSWDDVQLRKLFQKYAGHGAVITEARIMRDLRNVDANGVGKSKEYGFVSFSTHEAALEALRHINNNPTIFTAAKRPIVSFSIESRAVLKAKQQRLERSRAKNRHRTEKTVLGDGSEHTSNNTGSKHKRKARKRKPMANNNDAKMVRSEDSTVEAPDYAGVTSRPGKIKLATKFALNKQANLHAKIVKQNKRKEKLKQKRTMKHPLNEPIKQPKQKQSSRRKRRDGEDGLNKLIDNYKSKLNSATGFKKWFE